MARIKNVSGENRSVPSLGDRLVLAGQVIDVADDDVYSFTQQTTLWAPADPEAATLLDEGERAYQARLEQIDAPHPPAGNASRDEWAAYVVTADLATEADIADLGRDAIRDTYGPNAGDTPAVDPAATTDTVVDTGAGSSTDGSN